MQHKWLIINIILSFWGGAAAQDQVAYIRKYQDMAMAEMVRSGIPASIKLAQAILESNCGQSELACKANNHFGIKCGGSWSGKSFHKEDDDYANGQLIKSCFREFNSVQESYRAHSDFLTDPAKAARYGALFDLEKTDYKAWAHGLSKSGYATDPQYANRLIQIIEKYELFRFDSEYESMLASKGPTASVGRELVKMVNNVNYAIALEGDNAIFIGKRYKLSPNQILKYNEELRSKEQQIAVGTRIFLEPKKSKYSGHEQYHVVKDGEDLAAISKWYGIKVNTLAKRNHLEPYDMPAPKQKIMLKGKAKNKIKTIDPYEVPSRKKVNDIPSKSTVPPPSTIDEPAPNTMQASVAMEPGLLDSTHTVTKGDTLYAISRRYGMTLESLRKKNNLSADTIYIGQKLMIQ